MNPLSRIERRLRRGDGGGFGQRSSYWYLRNAARMMIAHQRSRALTTRPLAPPIVMSFVRRSGSTWLTQMMAALPGVVSISDPLLERNAWLAARMGRFQLEEMYLYPAQIAPVSAYLGDTLALRKRYAALDYDTQTLQADRITPFVKIANAPWLMPWMGQTYGATTFALVRHPIDVARSQLKHWNMPDHLGATAALLTRHGDLDADQAGFVSASLAKDDPMLVRLIEIVLEQRLLWAAATPACAVVSYRRLRDRDFGQLDFLDARFADWQDGFLGRFEQRSKTTQAENTLLRQVPHSPQERGALDRVLDIFAAQRLMHLV